MDINGGLLMGAVLSGSVALSVFLGAILPHLKLRALRQASSRRFPTSLPNGGFHLRSSGGPAESSPVPRVTGAAFHTGYAALLGGLSHGATVGDFPGSTVPTWLVWAGSLGAGAAVTSVAVGSLALGVAIATAAGFGVGQWVGSRKDRTAVELRSQLPALFTGMASSVGAGLSLGQALGRVADSADEPLSGEMRSVVSAMTLGTPLVKALEGFAAKTSVPELEAAMVGVGIQFTTGGAMTGVLEQAAHQLRQSEHLRRAVQTATAQGRMTLKMVTIVPVVLAALMAVLTDGYLQTLVGTDIGRNLLALAIFLETLGAYFVARILRIAV